MHGWCVRFHLSVPNFCATDIISLPIQNLFSPLSHILTFHLHLFPFSSCLVLSFLHLLLSFDLITWFSPSNRFTWLLSPCSLSRSLSLSLSFPLYFHLWALSLHPLSPSSLPILICSSLWRKGERKREFLTSKLLALCRGRASAEPASRLCTLGLWNLKKLTGTQSRRCLRPIAAQVQKRRRDHVVCGKGEFLFFLLL